MAVFANGSIPPLGLGHGGETSALRAPQVSGAHEPADAQMDQIRELLFGPVRAELMTRFEALERRVTDLERAVAAARQQDDARRRAAFDQLATGIAQLSQEVRQLTKP